MKDRARSVTVILIVMVTHIAHAAGDTTTTSTVGMTRQELEDLIQARTQALEAVNQQLETTQKNLQGTRDQKTSLQRELTTLQYNVNQLELNIQSDQITVDKLGLEVESLNYDIRDIELSVSDKQNAIISLLRELQKNDQTNLLVTLLKSNSLADGFLETQSLKDLRTQLAADVVSLGNLRGQLNDKLAAESDRKQQIELHKTNLAVRKTLVQDQKAERQTLLTQTKDKETLYAQQLAELGKQQSAISDEISKIEDQLRAAFDPSLLPAQRHGVLAWPTPLIADGGKGRITQHFGERSALYGGKPHNGLDIGIPIGTPIFAAEAGTVMAVGNNDQSSWRKYQYGKYILIKHDNNLATLYAHLSSQLVKPGMTVARGQLIGYSGNTGYTTGPHLHFGLYWAPSIIMKSIPPAAGLVPVGVVVDPELYL
jgi:murein DD-endopeptidase MepM/ murein hydrolase activator NlpD